MNRQLLVIAALAAIALVSAPAALAAGHPDDRAYARSTVDTPSPHPDDRAVGRTTVVDVRPVAGGTHADDRALARGPVSSPEPVLVRSAGPRFDWLDATIGAAGGLGIALALFGAVVGIHRRKIVTA